MPAPKPLIEGKKLVGMTSVSTGDFERHMILLNELSKPMDFSKNFTIVIEHDIERNYVIIQRLRDE